MKKDNRKDMRHRTIALLDRQEMEYLDKLGKESMFSIGRKLTYSDILKALVDLARELGISGENVDSPETLKKIFYELSRRKLDKEFEAMAKKFNGEAKDEKSNP